MSLWEAVGLIEERNQTTIPDFAATYPDAPIALGNRLYVWRCGDQLVQAMVPFLDDLNRARPVRPRPAQLSVRQLLRGDWEVRPTFVA